MTDHETSHGHAPHDKLATMIQAWSGTSENVSTAIEGLSFFRRTRPTEPDLCLVEPALLVVAQGAKQMFVGGAPHRYDPSGFLITSLEIPGQTQIIEASPDKPCLGLVMRLDQRMLAEMVARNVTPPRHRAERSSVAVGAVTPELISPLERLVALLDEPGAIPVLAPLILQEIHYRLLLSDQGARLWSFVAAGNPNQRILALLNWMKLNYAAPLRVEELAERAQMSPSTFHQHFRDLTTMSPLKYQKWLRLNEARQLMLNDHLDAASASYRVGYESPSQFSREYSRLFGNPPKRDIDQLRLEVAH
ncbi:AraC family transcriptional regulator [Allosediminivita pacifica]|uniref:AraC-like DNA-binding protein n=1 Tax=Allosediminivita pacifica TaxID=1267769 RepID=A0A2T6A2P9_9RHOB|nr:AraC family transcriptional regulator [Allosediminivita pacifica]PTX38086.1 AraC-like DNA-binding protein [Allosediminivita pacifica]GGB29624.1 AraC family transcriptional regulator [Allosediminivita pacifica]